MKIGIIGPNKIYDTDVNRRKDLLDIVAEIIARSNNKIVLTPDKNSLLEYFGKQYAKFGGKKTLLVIPTEESDHKEHLNTKIGDIIDCQIWDKQADEFNRQSDIYVCVGFAWGAMKEIACAQYFNKKKIYVLKEFITSELPKELNFLLEYIEISDLATILK